MFDPIRMAPLGKPVRKTTEAPPLEVPHPDRLPAAPAEPQRVPEKVPG